MSGEKVIFGTLTGFFLGYGFAMLYRTFDETDLNDIVDGTTIEDRIESKDILLYGQHQFEYVLLATVACGILFNSIE